MSAALSPAEAIALQVLQQATGVLVRWADPAFDPPVVPDAESPVILRAKALIGWSDTAPVPLRLVFDCIQLDHAQSNQHYRPAWAIERQNGEKYPRIPYAQPQSPNADELQELKTHIRTALDQLQWHNPAQLTVFLEKFGSHLSLGDSDVALIDLTRSTAAVAAALAQTPTDETLALIGGDLMGVQKFIYTISSEGALKSLRARSFYLELATEEIVQRLLDELGLPRTNVIYAGASKFYLLVAATNPLEETLERIQREFNDWLLKTFQRKVFLAIAHDTFPAEHLTASDFEQTTPLAQIWQQVNDKLTAQASRKFEHQIDEILKQRASYPPCKVCHRDDVPESDMQRLNDLEEDSPLVCSVCKTMHTLGGRLPKVRSLIRTQSPIDLKQDITVGSSFYHLEPVAHPERSLPSDAQVFPINSWDLADYPSHQYIPLLLANYFQASQERDEANQEIGGFITASEMAKVSEGIKRVGYLRMDVDRLSQIFSKGLGGKYTLPRLTSLSRQMTYFFKVYLNSLAQSRTPNFLEPAQSQPKFKFLLPAGDRPNLLFIYAGGDDLFVSGAWNEAVEFAFDVYQAFRAYTGYHPSITLSGGISIAGPKFPLYQAAQEAGEAEDVAKGNGRDSLGLFNAALKWDEWLGNWNVKILNPKDMAYLNSPMTMTKPALFGVLPFVERLSGEIGQGYTRSFVRNLLNTAQMQEVKIKEAKEKSTKQVQDIRYYLHLPKIAYTLARLPNQILDDSDFRKSLKSPYNAPYFRAIATWIELLNR